MDSIVDLKPCPFCGSLSVAIVGSFVRCGGCGAVGPYGYTNEEAAERWNRRVCAVAAFLDVDESRVVAGGQEQHLE